MSLEDWKERLEEMKEVLHQREEEEEETRYEVIYLRKECEMDRQVLQRLEETVGEQVAMMNHLEGLLRSKRESETRLIEEAKRLSSIIVDNHHMGDWMQERWIGWSEESFTD